MLNKDMSKYVDDVKIFMKETTVADLMEHWPGHEVPRLNRLYSKMIAKFNGDPQTYTLENVDKFRRRLCSYVRLSEFVCGLVSFEPSESFFAVWIFPTAIAPQLTEAISKLMKHSFKTSISLQWPYSCISLVKTKCHLALSEKISTSTNLDRHLNSIKIKC